MATHSSPLPMTQVIMRRSFKASQKESANASNSELDTEGESGYKVRGEDKLSKVELLCLQTLDRAPTAQSSFTLDFTTLFNWEGLKDQLADWPLFYLSKEESGIELQQGFVTLWSNFLVAETLMASISIQPLVMVPDRAHGWQLKVYGYIWMMSMVCDVWGIALTALLLGFLLGVPSKVSWNWMCAIGCMRSIPSILVLLDTVLTLVAIAYTCWIFYGYQVGIVCIVMELLVLGTMYKLAAILGATALIYEPK